MLKNIDALDAQKELSNNVVLSLDIKMVVLGAKIWKAE